MQQTREGTPSTTGSQHPPPSPKSKIRALPFKSLGIEIEQAGQQAAQTVDQEDDGGGDHPPQLVPHQASEIQNPNGMRNEKKKKLRNEVGRPAARTVEQTGEGTTPWSSSSLSIPDPRPAAKTLLNPLQTLFTKITNSIKLF